MAKNFNIEDLDADLSLALEIDGTFGYKLNEDGKTFTVEQYADNGEVEKTYTMSVVITENV